MPTIANKTDCERDNIMLKSKAVQKVSTLNPPTILAHSKMITALITSKNNPKVRIVNGNVKMTNIGFIKTLNNPKTTATSNEVVKLFTTTPFINRAITSTKIDVIRILKSNFIYFFISNL